MISVIIPAYNECLNLKKTIIDLSQYLSAITAEYEIIIVDDHSSDLTFQEVLKWDNRNVECIRLSRRGGSHTAIRAGLQYVKGQCVLCIAADGQENLGVLPEMIKKWKEGSQIVWGLRKARDENFVIRVSALLFYKLLQALSENSGNNIDLSRADFFLLDRKVINALNFSLEKNTSLFGLLVWLGFDQDFVEYDRRERRLGRSKWNFSSRLRLATDWIIAFSGIPLKLMTLCGFCVALSGFLYAIIILWNAFNGQPVEGWTSMIIIILLLGGIQMIMLGVVGEYLWRNLDESRKRPLFFVEKSTLQ